MSFGPILEKFVNNDVFDTILRNYRRVNWNSLHGMASIPAYIQWLTGQSTDARPDTNPWSEEIRTTFLEEESRSSNIHYIRSWYLKTFGFSVYMYKQYMVQKELSNYI